MFVLFIVTGLLFSVKTLQTSHFHITIKNAEVKCINETIFCHLPNNSLIEIKIFSEQNGKTSSNRIFLNNSIQISGKNIQVLPSIRILNGSGDDSIQFNKLEVLTKNLKTINRQNFTYNYALDLNIAVKCQEGFLSSVCSEIDLCTKVPPGMCQNQGSCIQYNSTISCQCSKEFTGNFCEEKHDPCENNFCSNNSTCHKNSNTTLNYECLCPPNFHGKFCNKDVNECLNKSICSHLFNATCFNTYGGYICTCNKECGSMTTTFSSTTIMYTTTSFIKWPLSDLSTLVLVSLEAAIIVTLILVLIFVCIKYCPIKKNKSKFLVDDAYLFTKLEDNKKKNVDYDSNYIRRPMISDKHESLVPMYDIQELENTFNNQSGNSPGMSTFGRR